VKKADLQPPDGANPNRVGHGVTVLQINDAPLTEMFLPELREKHLVVDATVLVDSAPRLQAAFGRHGLRFQYERHGNRNSVERIFREVIPRSYQFQIIQTT